LGVDALVWQNNKSYFFKDDKYVEYCIGPQGEGACQGFPKTIKEGWPGLAEIFLFGIEAAVAWLNDKIFFFRGDQYVRYTMGTDVDPGHPLPLCGKLL
jgi:hypothetical protein